MTTDPWSGTWRSEHDAFGRRTTEIDPLGHEARSWYDAAGNMITRVDGSGKWANYTYDGMNRLGGALYADGTRLSRTYPDGSVLNSTWDEAGRLTNMTMDDQTWTLAYDEDGRMTSILHPNGLELNYTYNGAGWPTSVRPGDTAGGSVVEGGNYTYDDIGNRLAQEQGNGTEHRE